MDNCEKEVEEQAGKLFSGQKNLEKDWKFQTLSCLFGLTFYYFGFEYTEARLTSASYTKMNFIIGQYSQAEMQARLLCACFLVNLPAGRRVPIELIAKLHRYNHLFSAFINIPAQSPAALSFTKDLQLFNQLKRFNCS